MPQVNFSTSTQAMVYQPNWDHLDEDGGCCMLFMVYSFVNGIYVIHI